MFEGGGGRGGMGIKGEEEFFRYHTRTRTRIAQREDKSGQRGESFRWNFVCVFVCVCGVGVSVCDREQI